MSANGGKGEPVWDNNFTTFGAFQKKSIQSYNNVTPSEQDFIKEILQDYNEVGFHVPGDYWIERR